ncbi:tyrosine-type recombinase/integrase [Klebsiella quasipneumoniae]|uniref:tyrosine-type recombinase/integrase n=1 Tax=Klebsiella quasipneumoniae TaxID=1463165 RepID=UPI001887CEC9|nr:site-specific integrase [Klebsiella quasipneumoniae]
MLTDTKLKKALGKKRDDIEVLSDSHGLNVRISQAGKITFFYRYRWQGKPVKINVGDYPAMSIAQARDRRQQFRAWLTEGKDPREQVKLERISRQDALSVEEAFNYWIERHCIANNLTNTTYYQSVFAKHISVQMKGVKVDNSTRRHWTELFDSIESRVMAHYMLSLCKRAFRFCFNRGVISTNPLDGLIPTDVGQKPKISTRRLSDEELRTVYQWLKNHMSIESVFLVKFIMLTGCRTGEIRQSKRSWFQLDECEWTVPAKIYKTRVNTRRGLPDAAVNLVKSHLEMIGTKHLVTSQRRVDGEILDKPVQGPVASNYARSIWSGANMQEWSMHDLRRTIATTLSELGAPPHVIEKILGHQMVGVMAHYNLHDYIDDQKHWLRVWQSHLEKVIGEPFC